MTDYEYLNSLLLACKNIGPRWMDCLEFWDDEAPEGYAITSLVADYIVDMYEFGETGDFEDVFKVLDVGAASTQKSINALAVVGVLESVQNISSHKPFGPDVFLEWMSPKLSSEYLELRSLWEREGNLANVILSERGNNA